MHLLSWDMLDWLIAISAAGGWWFFAVWLSHRAELPWFYGAFTFAIAASCTAAIFGWMPDWPLLLLLLAALVVYAVANPEFRQRGGWLRASVLLGAAAFVLGAGGLGRLAGLFGHPDWMRYQDAWTTAGLLLMAPGVIAPTFKDAKPDERRLFRFLGRSARIPALLVGFAVLLNSVGVLRDWQAVVVLAVMVTAWGLTALAYIFTNGFGRAPRKGPSDSADAAHHATQR